MPMTGDVAYSGKAEEYAKACDFFRNLSVVLSVPQHNFFLFPVTSSSTDQSTGERTKGLSRFARDNLKWLNYSDHRNCRGCSRGRK